MVGRAVGGQGAVIAFDTAFNLVAAGLRSDLLRRRP